MEHGTDAVISKVNRKRQRATRPEQSETNIICARLNCIHYLTISYRSVLIWTTSLLLFWNDGCTGFSSPFGSTSVYRTAFTTAPYYQQPGHSKNQVLNLGGNFHRQRRIHIRYPKISLSMVQTSSSTGSRGLSRYFQSILSQTRDRQRFVTGKDPVIVSVEDNPTQKWLNKDKATSRLLVNETSIDRSLASYDRFQWLDDVERQELHDRYASVSLELLAEVHMPKPGYVRILPRDEAGASAAAVRSLGSSTKWNRWENSSLYQELFLDELLIRSSDKNDKETIATSSVLKNSTAMPTTLEAAENVIASSRHARRSMINKQQDRLWVTGFSLAGRKGVLQSMDVNTGYIDSVNARSEAMTLWPNEVSSVPHSKDILSIPDSASPFSTIQRKQQQDALLVSDGFLVPGKDRGGIYLVKNPGNPYSEWTVPLTDRDGESWFYHRAVWVDLTGDGRKSVLTARAKLRKVAGDEDDNEENAWNRKSFDLDQVKRGLWDRLTGKSIPGANDEDIRPKNGQLVWLEMPKPHHIDEATGTPLEEDGTEFDPFSLRHLPWKERVLARGPDVMFSVADMDPTDDTIEVISSQFFDKKVTLHSITRGVKPRISFSRIIDDRCGAAFGGILADLDRGKTVSDNSKPLVLDSGSTVESLQMGDSFSHLVVTSHECDYAEQGTNSATRSPSNYIAHQRGHEVLVDGTDHSASFDSVDEGGSLFTYKVPKGKGAWRTDPWLRTTIASGFKVKGQIWNVINPGAPGFVYTFHAKINDRNSGKQPLIAVAGDCAESAFIFRPEKADKSEGARSVQTGSVWDPDAQYKLMCEIKCGATVGSIGVGYERLCSVEQEVGYAKLYIPCYEKDKILVFALGSGEDEQNARNASTDMDWQATKSVLV